MRLASVALFAGALVGVDGKSAFLSEALPGVPQVSALSFFQPRVQWHKLGGENTYKITFKTFNHTENLEACAKKTLKLNRKSFDFWEEDCYINDQDTSTYSLEPSNRYSYYEAKATVVEKANEEVVSKHYENQKEGKHVIYEALAYSRAVYCDKEQVFPVYNCAPCKDKINEKFDSDPSQGIVKKYFKYEQANIVAFVSVNSVTNTIWLSFRGTQPKSLMNWITNIKIAHFDFRVKEHGKIVRAGNLHGGFHRAWMNVKEPILAELDAIRAAHPGIKLGITGHSLGGAIASVACADLYGNHDYLANYFVSFGQPRVGDRQFSEWWDTHISKTAFVMRVKHNRDIVPSLPQRSSFEYHHFGPTMFQKNSYLWENKICVLGEDYSCKAAPGLSSISDHGVYLNFKIGASACKAVGTNSIDDEINDDSISLSSIDYVY